MDLLAGRESPMELDTAALFIAQLEYPDLDPSPWLHELDSIAFAIAERAGDVSDEHRFLETAISYLFEHLGFAGNVEDYYDAANSCLNQVLERRRGIPITLSVVFIEVARRLAKPVHGVGLPGHFIVRYESAAGPVFIDPFHGGAILDEAACYSLAGMDAPDPSVLEPVDRGQIVMRMLNNLRGIYATRRDMAKLLPLLDLVLAAAPESADEHRQRGAVLLQLKRITEALQAFQNYLRLAPDAPDRDLIQEQVKNLSHWLASRN